ncbi:T-cell surface protein tactile [Erinaceus europaeus]|uniref:T-cell surface protein tactile n=1 Tax=Erinaceus europaeus TaxID=9365 RepID=A0A1S2ZAH6_ERIEU|nr:T-cell surface protein tactile [Erinaceus europaeus]
MEKKWAYRAVYSIIQIHFVRGLWEDIYNAREDIYALPGSDVNLTCQTQKKGFLVQMQWSKITDKEDLIALYHPQHGFYCARGSPCGSLVDFKEMPGNVSKWILYLRNMSSSLSGKYECTFTLYPEGIWTKTYTVLMQTTVTQDEWSSNHTIESEINSTLEIPCFQNMSSDISSEFTFAWSVEDNGTREMLITGEHPICNSTLFKGRVKLGTNYSLHLSSIQIYDDDQNFSCHIKTRHGKILRSSTTVKVFAKPEVPLIVENDTLDVMGKRTFICMLKKVFPTATLRWFIDGSSPQDKQEVNITNENRKNKGGFLEVKSVLTRMYGNKPGQSNNLTIWCMALSPAPGNKVWNISSEKITFSLGSVNLPTDPPLKVIESTLGTQPSPAKSTSSTRYSVTASLNFTDVTVSTPNTRPQISNSNVTTQSFNNAWSTSGNENQNSISSWMSSETYRPFPSDAGSTPIGDNFISSTGMVSEVPTTINGSHKNNLTHIPVHIVKKSKDEMSWPVIVAALLFSCLMIFALGVRKWCQYQKEILERPPPFKPPPPPIKYTCIQESIGSDLPCHEMETL